VSKPLRVGLIGFGLAGQAFHAPVIRSVAGMQLACVLERHGALAQQKYPDVRVARTLDELLQDEQIRLWVVATPNSSHFELARLCLLAGRDVVVDKPLTVTSREAADLIELADQRQRLLSVYHNRRWDGDFLTVRKLVESGVLGRVVECELHYDRFRPQLKPNAWRERDEPGSGVLFDLGPHLLDQAFVLFGVPETITANVFCQRDGAKVDDAFDLRLDYPRLHVVLHASMLACAPGPRFLLHGTRGSFVKYGSDPQEAALRRGEVPGGTGWGMEPEEQWGTLYLADEDSPALRRVRTEVGDYRGFYENIRDAIVKGAPLAVTPREALRTVRALELAHQSNTERRTVPWDSNR
jgi:scyllo-inositol 2-dehydrogenase (NADP+)